MIIMINVNVIMMVIHLIMMTWFCFKFRGSSQQGCEVGRVSRDHFGLLPVALAPKKKCERAGDLIAEGWDGCKTAAGEQVLCLLVVMLCT